MCEGAGSGLGMHEGIHGFMDYGFMDGLWIVLLRGMDDSLIAWLSLELHSTKYGDPDIGEI